MALQLGWFANAQMAGEFTAIGKGYFKDAGIDVRIVPGGPSDRRERGSPLGEFRRETPHGRPQFGDGGVGGVDFSEAGACPVRPREDIVDIGAVLAGQGPEIVAPLEMSCRP